MSDYTSKSDQELRIQTAIAAYNEADGKLSISKAANIYSISKATLSRRLKGQQSMQSFNRIKQKLSEEEELILIR